jgi:hypothetical protein
MHDLVPFTLYKNGGGIVLLEILSLLGKPVGCIRSCSVFSLITIDIGLEYNEIF